MEGGKEFSVWGGGRRAMWLSSASKGESGVKRLEKETGTG